MVIRPTELKSRERNGTVMVIASDREAKAIESNLLAW